MYAMGWDMQVRERCDAHNIWLETSLLISIESSRAYDHDMARAAIRVGHVQGVELPAGVKCFKRTEQVFHQPGFGIYRVTFVTDVTEAVYNEHRLWQEDRLALREMTYSIQ